MKTKKPFYPGKRKRSPLIRISVPPGCYENLRVHGGQVVLRNETRKTIVFEIVAYK